jgi:hypothetical protein
MEVQGDGLFMGIFWPVRTVRLVMQCGRFPCRTSETLHGQGWCSHGAAMTCRTLVAEHHKAATQASRYPRAPPNPASLHGNAIRKRDKPVWTAVTAE